MKGVFFTLIIIVGCLSLSSVQSQPLRVLSYNIHHGADRYETNTIDSMGYFIAGLNPDIVGLQEVDSVCERSAKIDQMKRLSEKTGMHAAFVRHFPYQGGAYGVGILSKYPILKTESKQLKLLKKGPNGEFVSMLFATIQLPGKKRILFITAHYSAFDSATRRSQVNETLAYLSKNTLPVVFTGDLNATPDTEDIQVLQKHLTTVDTGKTLTFPETTPVKKIDYILVSPQALGKVEKVLAPQVYYSDHLPFMASFELKF